MFEAITFPKLPGLQLLVKEGNSKDPYAVALVEKTKGAVVGHVPRKISAACSLFIRRDGTILCTVTGRRQSSQDLPQGVLEVPCNLKFQGEEVYVEKIKRLLKPVSGQSVAVNEDQQLPKRRKLTCDEDMTVNDGEIIDNHTTSMTWLSLGGIVLSNEDRKIVLTNILTMDRC